MRLMFGTAKRFYSSVNIELKPTSLKKLKLITGLGSLVLGGGVGSYIYYDKYYQTELSRDYFTKYRITRKLSVDSNHYLIQMTPLKPQQNNIWATMGSSKLWSIEVKQPEVMVVRSYTPLPLKLHEDGTIEVLHDGDNGSGALSFYIKQYDDGEVARWINRLPIGHVLELRGPYIEYEIPEPRDELKRSRDFLWNNPKQEEPFKYQPLDILFFTGGTGIVTMLQMALTESPFRGRIGVYHACKSTEELGPLYSILLKLQDAQRIQLHTFESQKKNSFRSELSKVSKLVGSPAAFTGIEPFKGFDKDLKPVLSLVCGPEGFITAVSGPKYETVQGPIKGLLGCNGWDNSNVYKLS